MKEIELSAGTIEYGTRTATAHDCVVARPLRHAPAPGVAIAAFLMNASLWDGPIAELSDDHRCVAPTLPFGAHRRAMHASTAGASPASSRRSNWSR
ncbi:hypothetical protein ACPPVO_33465 [Dactylosporangium sp. McL0621]|uniref:hypothetical protein n=1 Tax=Dactylosporangium sp. McL0621 TaxID=3415678 RepID=UPI003CE98642